MSGENLVKFLLGTLARVRDGALGVLGSGSPRSLVHHAYAWSHHADLPETGRGSNTYFYYPTFHATFIKK